VIVSYGLIALWVIRKKKRPMLLAGCIVILLCAALLLSWGLPQLDSYRVTVLDVGQGQCILLQSGGKTYMVDCGGSYDEDAADIAAETLLSQGIRRLDGLILTHYDKDHVGGAQYLLQRIFADVLILPEGDKDQRWDPKLLAAHEGTTLRATEDIFLRWDGGELRIFSSWTTETSNESSLCVLFHTEKCDILITGDRSSVGEEILLLMEDIPQLDALIVGHHGSEKSTSETLLAATRPKLALISVGEDNSYDHPAAEVLERLNAYGCIIRRTDLEGTIIIRG
jgi:competence protein ComEC